jgi:hypothetical protein
MPFTEKSQKPTIHGYAKLNAGDVSPHHEKACTYSRQVQVIPNQRVIKQKHRRWRQRINEQIEIARMLDLPMTPALTINWEQICGAKELSKSIQSAFLRRLLRLSRRLRFELAYIWVIAFGTKVGLHAHMMFYWPQRFLRDLVLEVHRLTQDPTAIHIQSINLNDQRDYHWGKYLADHIIKHSYCSQNRNFGCSRNLRIPR